MGLKYYDSYEGRWRLKPRYRFGVYGFLFGISLGVAGVIALS